MFEALDHVTFVGGLAGGGSDSLVLGLSEADQQALMTKMTMGTLAGATIGGGAGWYAAAPFMSRLRRVGNDSPMALIAVGLATWLVGRNLTSLAPKTTTADGLRSITTMDVALATAPGSFGLMLIAIGAAGLVRGRLSKKGPRT